MRLTVTREDYFEAALTLLAQHGAAKLGVGTLCRALNISTGSFYGYFGGFDAFVVEFLKHWEQLQTEHIIRLLATRSPSSRRQRFLKELVSHFPYEAEAAMRAWAHTNARMADVQKRIDEHRLTALTAALQPEVGTHDEAHRLAMIGMTLFVGLQQWRPNTSALHLNLIIDQFEGIVASRTPPSLRAVHRTPGRHT